MGETFFDPSQDLPPPSVSPSLLSWFRNLMGMNPHATEGPSMGFSLPSVLGSALPGYGIDPTSAQGQAMRDQVRQQAYDIGMNLGPGAMVFHGSPHLFDAFKMDKIGTGEGAQAYGHGLYFAENPGVAKSYIPQTSYADTARKFLANLPEDAGFDEIRNLIGKGHFTPQQENVLKELDKHDWLGFDYPSQAISQAYRGLKDWDVSPDLVRAVNNSGNLYKVDLPDEAIGKMLDWDKPLSQQPESVRNVLEPLQDAYSKVYSRNAGEVYKRISDKLGGQEKLSAMMTQAGVPGIKYLDQGSRSSGKGTYNYVVFDENLPKIVGRE